MSALVIAAALWLDYLTRPPIPTPPPPPTAGVPRGEVPRNVRPWRETVTTPTTAPDPCPPPKEKR